MRDSDTGTRFDDSDEVLGTYYGSAVIQRSHWSQPGGFRIRASGDSLRPG